MSPHEEYTADVHSKEGFKPYIKKPVIVFARQMEKPFTVKTMEGTLRGKAGDYLLIGVKGARYPCGREIFEKTYEEFYKGWRMTKIFMPKKG